MGSESPLTRFAYVAGVNDGYATQRSAPLPPTPHSSLAKPSTTCSGAYTTSSVSPIFRSANDTLLDVFASPSRVMACPVTPSPKKRSRSEFDDDATVVDGDDDRDMDSDDEPVLFFLGPSPGRPMKPLKRSGLPHPPCTPGPPASHTLWSVSRTNTPSVDGDSSDTTVDMTD